MNRAQRKSYSREEKLKVVKRISEIGQRATSREFDIPLATLNLWTKPDHLRKLQNMKKGKRACRFGKNLFPTIERHLVTKIEEMRQQELACPTDLARDIARQIATEKDDIPDSERNSFVASSSWIRRFLKRNNFSIRRRTHVSQKLPADYEEKLINFQRFIIRERTRFNFELRCIGNADQTPVYLDMPSDITINKKGEKTVSIRTTGNEKVRLTCMLSVLADGTKLPPYVVLKRKTLPKETVPGKLIVRVQENGWMDENLVKDWLKTVWCQLRPGGLTRKKGILVLDSYAPHKSENVKKILEENNCRLAIIPGGMTGTLQPLDVSINRPFKSELRKQWTNWMMSNDHEKTPAGKIKRPTLNVIYKWIETAWDAVSVGVITKSFKKCSISNALDGTEDDALFEEFVERQTNTDESDASHSDEDEESENEEDEQNGLVVYNATITPSGTLKLTKIPRANDSLDSDDRERF